MQHTWGHSCSCFWSNGDLSACYKFIFLTFQLYQVVNSGPRQGKDRCLSLVTTLTFCPQQIEVEGQAAALKFEPHKRKRPQNWRLLISRGMQPHRNKPLLVGQHDVPSLWCDPTMNFAPKRFGCSLPFSMTNIGLAWCLESYFIYFVSVFSTSESLCSEARVEAREATFCNNLRWELKFHVFFWLVF